MRPYGLRLLVALLTFGVGVAAASLLSFGRSRPCGKRTRVYAPAAVSMAAREEPPPPPRAECFLNVNRVIAAGMLDGKAISLPQPAYPPIARAARARGPVTVVVQLDESGEVISAHAKSGHPLLQQAAVAAAREAKFSPTLLSGQPVKVSGFVTYKFALE